MRTSPTFMGVIYFLIGIMFMYLAIQNVSTAGWNFWTFLFIGVATIDIVIGIRFFRLKKQMESERKE
ncbi:YdiK family protein [Desertibacillus haloalkaliphilus]|uniref:YdiK family protein n=1 Tax=Desertibacillus haloalkaliphilus TaxID=1328930 RepID=UPI001C26ECC7|nr:YdiK family protein [Desertibacillus haloalkaliphilus]MBU8908558.1 YdiK family protein [Desertibacillus haloalkaliphilus]